MTIRFIGLLKVSLLCGIKRTQNNVYFNLQTRLCIRNNTF